MNPRSIDAKTRWWIASLALATGACAGSNATTGATTVSDAAATEAGDDGAATTAPTEAGATDASVMTDASESEVGPYPTGPYGNAVGDVLENLAWEGYVSDDAVGLADTKPYVTTSLDQLRRKPNKGYAMVHVSEFF
jgi:hypothetical protein